MRKFAPPPTKFGSPAAVAKVGQAKLGPGVATPRDGDGMIGKYAPPPTKFGAPAAVAKVGQAKVGPGAAVPQPPAGPRPPTGPACRVQPTMPVSAVQRSIGPFDKRADDEIGARFSFLPSAPGTSAGKLPAFKASFKGHHKRPHFGASKANIEKQSLKVRKSIVKGGVKKPGALKAKETEVLGELAALHVMMTWPSMLGYEMVMPADPGHGRGIDQLWRKGPANAPTEYLVVEAKGPGAKLSATTGQMSEAWVISRLQQLANGSAPQDVKAHAARAADAIQKKKKSPRVRGIVLRAKWDLANTKLTASKSHDKYYTP